MKYRYILNGLTCPNCARKIEEKLTKNKKLNNVVVNFNTLTLSYEAKQSYESEVKNIVKSIEPNVDISSVLKEEKSNLKLDIILFTVGLLLTGISFLFEDNIFKNILIILSYGFLMYRTLCNALKKIVKSKALDENFLICISAIGAFLVDKPMEGVMVLALYSLGKILEAKAVNKTRKNIQELMNIRPEYANLKVGNKVTKVAPEKVKVGDVIIVKAGEKIPLDGIVIKGETSIDNSALTGESLYIKVKEQEEVLSGSINVGSAIEVQVQKLYVDSTVSKILELTENATDRKAKTENFVSSFAKYYVPTVLILAILVALLLPVINTQITYAESIYRGLIFLVISCPCAIAISVPLSYFCGIGKASSSGILIKGSDYLDALRNVSCIVLDKTGTITEGKFGISKIVALDNTYTEEELLRICQAGESLSNHPIARAISQGYNENGGVKDFKEIPGQGISFEFEGKKILIGSEKITKEHLKSVPNVTTVYIVIQDNLVGYIELEDRIKDNAKILVQKLKAKNINVKMFTGDSENIAKQVGEAVGVTDVKSKMLPQDKYNSLKELLDNKKEKNKKIAFVGDGINDSPVLALADIGISMGGVGSNSAIEASDVVIMTDNLEKIDNAISISKYTNNIIKANLIFAIGIKATFLILSVFGLTHMGFAVFADVGVTLINILNSIRILRKKI